MDFGAISRDFERKIWRPRKIFENFGRKSAANRTQSHVPQHADAPDSCWGPLRVVSKLRTTRRHGFWRDLTRFGTQNFANRNAENFRKLRSEIARNLTRHSMPTLGTDVGDLYGSCASCASPGICHGFWRDLTRFRMQNFAAAKIFRKFRSEIRRESHRISRATACRRSAQSLGTSEGRGQAAARELQHVFPVMGL